MSCLFPAEANEVAGAWHSGLLWNNHSKTLFCIHDWHFLMNTDVQKSDCSQCNDEAERS
jgi:leucyl-tRNA synthetase